MIRHSFSIFAFILHLIAFLPTLAYAEQNLSASGQPLVTQFDSNGSQIIGSQGLGTGNPAQQCPSQMPTTGAGGQMNLLLYLYLETGSESGAGCEQGYGTRAKNGHCIPHKTTNTFSPLDLSPWFLTNIHCKDAPSCLANDPNTPGSHVGPTGPYVGPLYRGGDDIYHYMNRLVGLGPNNAVDVCRLIISPNTLSKPYDPIIARKELDSCTNQYILFRSNLPRIPVDDQGELPDIRGGREKKYCQPLKMIPMGIGEEEYLPSRYYVEAWRKTMMDEKHLARDPIILPKEPKYSALGVKIKEPLTIRQDFGCVTINDLTETHDPDGMSFERIYDPTHPFSPRWDFEFNEREKYSPITAAYDGDITNQVRCAGSDSKDIKVDILKFREKAFDFYMMQRIAFNIVCWNLQIYGIYVCRYAYDFWDADEDSGVGPPCSTKWDGHDKQGAPCGAASVSQLCEHISKPVAPANVLKLRENNHSNFPQGVPQGYTFFEYFHNHRPYMRCWDTGLECGRTSRPLPGPLDTELNDDTGSKWAVMGVGREGQSCTIGGGNGDTNSQVDGEADPIMDWMELKLYQLRGMREGGINCIPKQDVMFKPYSGEEIIASRAGGQYQAYIKDTKDQLTRYRNFPWPLQWRGYVTAPVAQMRYPNLRDPSDLTKSGAPLSGTGLDDAKPGEVLIFDRSVVGTDRLPYIAYVTEANNPASHGEKPYFVKAVAYDHGKFPDTCGNTDEMGQGEEYTMYQDELPKYNQELFNEVGNHTDKCDDPMNSACIENLWDDVKRYFPKSDLRRNY